MEHRYTDKHAVDEAWDSMRTALDTHMPVVQKRRVIWWWFPLLAGVAMIGLWYFSNSVSADLEVPVQESTKQVEKVIASTEDTAVNPNENQISKEASASINFEDNLNSNTKTEIEEKELTSSYKKQSQATSVDKTIAKAESNSSQNLNQDQNVKIGAPIKLESKTKIKAETVSLISETKRLNEKPKTGTSKEVSYVELATSKNRSSEAGNIADIETNVGLGSKGDLIDSSSEMENKLEQSVMLLERISLLPLDFEEHSVISIDAVNIGSLENKRWQWSLRAAAIADPWFVFANYHFSTIASRKLSSRWSLGTGLGLNLQKLYLTNYYLRWGTQTSSLDLSTGEATYDPNLSGDANFIKDKKIIFNTFGYIPIMVDYKFKSRWLLQGGMNYNFALGESQTNKNHLEFHVSPAYRLSKRVALGLQMQHSTRRTLNDGSEPGRNQLGVFLKYQL